METIRIVTDVVEMDLPASYIVCPRCEGHGKHTNPSIDGNGIPAEDMAEDPEFFEDYMSGVYDVRCERCEGQRVVLTVDLDRLTEEQRETYDEWIEELEEEANYQAERAHEIRMGY